MIHEFEIEDTDYFSNKTCFLFVFFSHLTTFSRNIKRRTLRSVLSINNMAFGFPRRNTCASTLNQSFDVPVPAAVVS